MNLHLTTVPAKLRGELDEAIETLGKAIKQARQRDTRSGKLETDLSALADEQAELANKSSLTDTEAGRINLIVTRRGALQAAIEREEAEYQPATRKLHAAYQCYESLIGRLASLLAKQLQTEIEPVLAAFYIPANCGPIAGQSDLVSGMMMRCMRPRYFHPQTLTEAIRWAFETLNLLTDFAEGRPLYKLEPEVPAKAA